MWQLITNHYDDLKQELEESLFMIGDGYVGVRGCFEEGYPSGNTVRGTYINGLYDRVPMIHAEMAYGFPTMQDKQPRILDTQTCEIWLDGEKAQLIEGKYEQYERLLDFQIGESKRSYVYMTKSSKRATLCFKRMAPFTEVGTLIYKVEVVYHGAIKMISVCNTDIENYSNPSDPRTGQGHTKLMELVSLAYDDYRVFALMQTKTTGIKQAVSIHHRISGCDAYSISNKIDSGKVVTTIDGSGCLILEKRCFFGDGLRTNDPLNMTQIQLKASESKNYSDYLNAQRLFLDAFWYRAGIEFNGAPDDQMAIRMMQYHLLQSVGVDAYSNVAAKGLSGEGYEGHYFWDTEIYVLPVLMMNQIEKARKLLEFRYHILPHAKERARELGHNKGACYAWRTISGIECSGYFPAGTAQYHINSDIAYAFIQYYLYTGDLNFMMEMGFEVIVETARLWMSIGHFYNGTFQIHDVTGPDEYTAIVNNNYYTNAMAKYHLYWAYKFAGLLNQLGDENPHIQVKTIFDRLELNDEELDQMLTASDKMHFAYDENKQLYAQDDSFLSKPIWPFESADPSKKPLLLHYHPLTIYRHQVLKQADTVLAHMLLEQYATEKEIIHAFNYYEKITTHDSSLSSCIYGIMASKIGEPEKAYHYFKESVYLDYHDAHKNTKDGLHMANMAGTLLSVTSGFGGLRITENGISLKPQKPAEWSSLSFKINFQGRTIEVIVADEVKVTLLEGAPIEIKIWDKSVWLNNSQTPIKGIVFDLDGVITETSKAHFEAWREMGHILGFEVPDELEDEVRGISRMDSLDIVLKYSEGKVSYSHEEKVALANQKNEMYLTRIKAYSPKDLSNGAIELLEYLKAKNIKIALASASNNAPFLLKAMAIDHYFDAVVDPSTLNHGKPEPDIFIKACEMLSLNPSECIGVEDAYAGIESILSAGLLPIGIGSKEHLTNCDVVLGGLDSLQQHLKEHLLK